MKHLNKFDNISQYESEYISLGFPNVSFIEEGREVRYSNGIFNESLVDAWIFSGRSNSDVDKNIVGVNGNSLIPIGFQWEGNSGYPEGVIDYTKLFSGARYYDENPTTKNSIELTSYLETDVDMQPGQVITIPAHKIRITCPDENFWFQVAILYNNDGYYDTLLEVTETSGVYDVPEATMTYNPNLPYLLYRYEMSGTPIKVELVTDREGSLCSDGIDDRLSSDLTILPKDYTVLCRRNYYDGYRNATLISFSSAIMIEYFANGIMYVISHGAGNEVSLPTSEVMYYTKNNYSGTPILSGDYTPGSFSVFHYYDTISLDYAKAAIYWLAVYDRTLSSEEIQKESGKLQSIWESKLI